ncbi:prolyl oligopeptidase family serine peptidase [Curtobacterium sp. MCLR17_007]|uniref:alpha/beta hydrolase n=1 Tax=Curtobacterium sp. MCLR17_007 TaxID=2175648 RepID=UPI0011B46CD5|nr:prolyl oligopeptidase family serine peptidase [Curtobacterium sp. MCLR17_007]WIB60168.1 prolyl oligopeptidase family serine peptidase [Curtobacterium sp. MCLR17_007]
MPTSTSLVTSDDGHTFACVDGSGAPGPTWVLLHGSDGSELDLLPLAERLAPSATKIAPRGTVRTTGGWAHFRRRADLYPVEEDLTARIEPLMSLVTAAQAGSHTAVPGRAVVMGFSNGAIMAAALLERHPERFAAGILLRPRAPFRADPAPAASSMPVLLLEGRDDARRTRDDGLIVADRLRSGGAAVTHLVLPVTHRVTRSDERAASDWLSELPADAP